MPGVKHFFIREPGILHLLINDSGFVCVCLRGSVAGLIFIQGGNRSQYVFLDERGNFIHAVSTGRSTNAS